VNNKHRYRTKEISSA